MKITVSQARTQLFRWIRLVAKGEEVIITRHGKPIVELVRFSQQQRRLGAEAHLAPFPEGWETPMSKEEADKFLGLSR